MAPTLTPRRIWIARALAVLVDLAQVALLPAELTPLNNAIDVVTAAVMVALVGWHWAFLPTFLVELVPFVDLVPSWTLAVVIATRGGSAAPPAALPPPGQPREDSGS
jgi:dolichyl-phosphate-mannose--protein O-mannosyl transferase